MKDTSENLIVLIQTLEDALRAKEILSTILSYYDIYSGQFEKIPDYQAEYMYKRADGTYITDTLNKKIRDYIQFDDSE